MRKKNTKVVVKKNTHGGKRPGAGRKTAYKMRDLSTRVPAVSYDKLKAEFKNLSLVEIERLKENNSPDIQQVIKKIDK